LYWFHRRAGKVLLRRSEAPWTPIRERLRRQNARSMLLRGKRSTARRPRTLAGPRGGDRPG